MNQQVANSSIPFLHQQLSPISFKSWMPDSLSCIPYGIRGTFHSTKISDFPVKWTQPKHLCVCSLSLQAGYKKVVLGTPINFSNEKAHFSLANQNDQTGHNGPPSMAVTKLIFQSDQSQMVRSIRFLTKIFGWMESAQTAPTKWKYYNI